MSGCLGGRTPATELYRLVPVSAAERGGGSVVGGDGEASGALAVGAYRAPGVYGGSRIVYRIGESSYGSYPFREWAIPLGDMLGVLTADIARGANVTAGDVAYDPPSRRHYTYMWHGAVREFEEVDRDKAVFASVALDAQLVRIADDSVVWSATRRAERRVERPTMSGIVAALSSLSAEVISALLADAKTALSSRPSAGPARRP